MKAASWEQRPLGRCAKFLSGGTPSKSRNEFWEGNIPWVSSGEMTEIRIHDTELHISEEAAANGSRLVPAKTVLAVVRGMSLAKEFRVVLTQREMAFNQDIKAFACEPDIDSEFLFYALLSRKEHIRELATEASHGTKKMETGVLASVPILVPRPGVQRQVVKIMSAYDDLIENNCRRIALLEGAARQLYREWFVRLRFPGYEHTRITNSVPEGWERRSLGGTFATVLGGTPSRTRVDFWDGGTIPWINSGKVNELRIIEPSELITENALKSSAAKLMPRGTTVLAITGATLGQVSMLEIECAANQSVVGIIDSTEIFSEWLYLTMKERIPELVARATGGAQVHINKDIVNAFEVTIPATRIAEPFKNAVAPMFRQIAILLTQNLKLRAARDLLLPRLMSGEIAV